MLLSDRDIKSEINCPNCGTKGKFTAPKQFSGLLKTYLGPVEDESGLAYLRPETAQGIFINFDNVASTSRKTQSRVLCTREEVPRGI